MNNDNLQETLSALFQSNSSSNPVINALLNDYARYHVAFVIIGGFFVVAFILISLFCLAKFRKASKDSQKQWPFEKKACLSLGIISIVFSVLLALITAANTSNALNPKHGFSLLIDSLGTPKIGTQMDKLHQAFNVWIQSGKDDIPSLIQGKIDDRIAFHTTKAIVCGLLLIAFVALSTRIWSLLIKKSRVPTSSWGTKERVFLALGSITIIISLLMVVIVIANTQGAFAPLTLTLLYG